VCGVAQIEHWLTANGICNKDIVADGHRGREAKGRPGTCFMSMAPASSLAFLLLKWWAPSCPAGDGAIAGLRG
jgi:hypothetical protein